MTVDVYDSILRSFDRAPIESGGILGMQENVITAFHFDTVGHKSRTFYVPDTLSLNQKIKDWTTMQISFAGIIHSHDNACASLSRGDLQYAERFTEGGITEFLMPIVTYTASGMDICFHKHCSDGGWTACDVRLIPKKGAK